jgi:malic enzyme
VERYCLQRDVEGRSYVTTTLRGPAVLRHPMLNKGTAFSAAERRALDLDGLLPPTTCDEDIQRKRGYEHIARKTDPLEKYIGLAALQDRNEILFHRVLLDHLEELVPIVYTPTVGRACQEYSHIFRRGRGVWISPDHGGRMGEVLANGAYQDVRLVVVTDNERILGLGDQGAGGMGIPIGKLTLYTAGAGIHPTWCLPVSLDVGTDNPALLDDPFYVGWRHERLRGAPYEELVDEFVTAVCDVFPRAVLQWEDFKKQTAFTLLDRYRGRLASFNDDIQGTAAVALAGIMAATRSTGVPMAMQRVVIAGAGAAGIGIARQLVDALARAGLHGDALRRAVAVVDSRGLLVEGETREPYKAPFAWPRAMIASAGLAHGLHLGAVVEALRPTVLVGATGRPGLFDEPLVRAMAAGCPRPVILPLSNPTAKCEAVPLDIVRWTDGRALVATGSPFADVAVGDRKVRVAQCNNVLVFPGIGLGLIASDAWRVDDASFTVAAESLAGMVTDDDLREGALYPSLRRLRELSAIIGVRVAVEAARRGLAPPLDEEEARRRVGETMWDPRYVEIRAKAAAAPRRTRSR